MTDRPIIFSWPMVRALLDGRKTQTRRVLKPPYGTLEYLGSGEWKPICTKFFRGDHLWVREAFSITNDGCWPSWLRYRADPEGTRGVPCSPGKRYGSRTMWRPSIHMPRWASRLTLTVTDVRVQRLQEITLSDARAEGCDAALALAMPRANGGYSGNSRETFKDLWNSIHGPDAWDENPWVCALTFAVHRQNIDKMGAADA